MEQWIHHHNRFLHILLDTERKPAFDKCSICCGHATIKCPDCFGLPSYCAVCILDSHRHSPFHWPLLWTVTHYTQVSLQSLRYSLFLGMVVFHIQKQSKYVYIKLVYTMWTCSYWDRESKQRRVCCSAGKAIIVDTPRLPHCNLFQRRFLMHQMPLVCQHLERHPNLKNHHWNLWYWTLSLL